MKCFTSSSNPVGPKQLHLLLQATVPCFIEDHQHPINSLYHSVPWICPHPPKPAGHYPLNSFFSRSPFSQSLKQLLRKVSASLSELHPLQRSLCNAFKRQVDYDGAPLSYPSLLGQIPNSWHQVKIFTIIPSSPAFVCLFVLVAGTRKRIQGFENYQVENDGKGPHIPLLHQFLPQSHPSCAYASIVAANSTQCPFLMTQLAAPFPFHFAKRVYQFSSSHHNNDPQTGQLRNVFSHSSRDQKSEVKVLA